MREIQRNRKEKKKGVEIKKNKRERETGKNCEKKEEGE